MLKIALLFSMNLRMKINSQRTYQHDFAFFHCFIIISTLFFGLILFPFTCNNFHKIHKQQIVHEYYVHVVLSPLYTFGRAYRNCVWKWLRLRWRWNVIHSCSWLISAKQQLNIYIVNFNSPGNHQVSLLTCFYLMNNYCSRASVQSFTIFLAVIIMKDVCFDCRLRWNKRHVLKINELK